MDKITKFLKKLSKKDREVIHHILEQLYSENTKTLDIKKLKGGENLFRVRKGTIRIVYSLDGLDISIINIEFRSEGTYK